MNQTLRIAAFSGALTLALAAAASAATVRLVPLAAHTAAVTHSACAVPSAAASIVATPVELPEIAAQQHVTGVAAVRVDLDARGTLAATSVLASSGNRWLDEAALRTARTSTYRAEVRACERVGGPYALIVDFTQ